MKTIVSYSDLGKCHITKGDMSFGHSNVVLVTYSDESVETYSYSTKSDRKTLIGFIKSEMKKGKL